MWRRMNRLKTLDTQSLHYSEWTRKLGSFDLLGFTVCLGLPLGIFVTVPYCAKYISGPSTLLSVILAFVVAIITGLHYVEMSMRMPKSGSIYTYTYATFGELFAFSIGWLAVVDYSFSAVYIVKAWSLHLNYVFNQNPHEYLNPQLHDYGNESLWAEMFDSVALIGLLSGSAIVMCSIKVAGTVCMVFATVCSLVIASSILVGFFYTNAANWIKFGYFVDSLPGVFTSAAYLLRSFGGVEALTCLTEEVGNYHSRFPIVIPLSNSIMFLFHFLTCSIVTLIVPYIRIPDEIALPNLFGIISVPASRYILSVGSVCGFSGAVVAVLIPPSRIVQNMAADGLLFRPLSKITRRGIPLAGHLLLLLIAIGGLFLKQDVLLDFLLLSLPLRYLTCTCMALLQRYKDTPSGLLAEVAHYKNLRKLRSLTSFLSNGSVLTVPRSDSVMPDDYDDDDDDIEENSSVCSSLVVRNVATQQWDKDGDRHSEAQVAAPGNQKTLQQHQNNVAAASSASFNECSSLLSPTTTATLGVTRSASKYAMPSAAKKNCGSTTCSMTGSLHTITLDDNRSLQIPHDCVRSPCTPMSDDPCFHLYQRDIPEILYAEKFDMHSTSNTAVNQTIIYGKAKLAVFVCVSTMVAFSCILTKCWWHLTNGQWWTIGAVVLCVVAVTLCVIYLCWLPKNVESSIGHQVPAVPYLSILNCLLLSFMVTVVSWSNLAKLLIVFASGLLIYAVYGYWHSVENVRTTTINVSVTNEEFHDNNCIINNAELEQTSLGGNNQDNSTSVNSRCNGVHRNSLETNN